MRHRSTMSRSARAIRGLSGVGASPRIAEVVSDWVRPRKVSCKAEVENDRAVFGIDDHISALQVTMDDPALMRVLEGRGDVRGVLECRRQRRPPPANDSA